MHSYQKQSSYQENPQTYSHEAHGPSRLEEYNTEQQAHVCQSSYSRLRGVTISPTAMSSGGNPSLQTYQAYRNESSDLFYLGNKDKGTSDIQAPKQQPSASIQSYGPPKGNSSSSKTGFSDHYRRERQFASQQSVGSSLSRYLQDFPRSFSFGGANYSTHVPSQDLRQQIYQSHQTISSSANPTASTETSHQIQSSAINSGAVYPLSVGHLEQNYLSSAGSNSNSFHHQRFGQSGPNYDSYKSRESSSPYESHTSGSSFGTQQGYSSYASQHLKKCETVKVTKVEPQGQFQQLNSPQVMQYSNSSKLLSPNQTETYNQSEVRVRSPVQFQQNYSPISNPSPAASVVHSPSCSSTPSPLTSGENFQSGQVHVQHPCQNCVLSVMPQLSPNMQVGSFKGFDVVEGTEEKHISDPGLNSLSALNSQVTNLPNNVQHVLQSDTLTFNKKSGNCTSRKTDSCSNSETSSQVEEHLKSPMAESLDGSYHSSLGDLGERERQLSGQSTSSEAGVKGLPSEKLVSPAHGFKNESLSKTVTQETDKVLKSAESIKEDPKPSEKSVGVIVLTETGAYRSEKVVNEVLTPTNNNKVIPEPELPVTATEKRSKDCPDRQNGEPGTANSVSSTSSSIIFNLPVNIGFDLKEAPINSNNHTNMSQFPKNSDTGNCEGQSDKNPRRSEKYPCLLQEVLQGHHQQERRYVRNTPDPQVVTESPEVPLRPNILMNQAIDQPNHNILAKSSACHLDSYLGQWDKKPILEKKHTYLTDYPASTKFEAGPSSCHEQSACPSERRSVICDVLALKQLVCEPTSSQYLATGQERSPDGTAGQSVILPSVMSSLQKTNYQGGVATCEDTEIPMVHRKQTGEQCMPFINKESTRCHVSQRSLTYDQILDYSSHNRCATKPKMGTGRVGSRSRSPAQSPELGHRLKMSSGRCRGQTEIRHVNQTEPASREALFSTFFNNRDSSLGYPTNSRSSSDRELHPTFTFPLHYKRQVYQQEEHKRWLGSSVQAKHSTLQHLQEIQRKNARQEPFNVHTIGRTESEGLEYSHQSSCGKFFNIGYNHQLCLVEGTPNLTKQNSQKTPRESPSCYLRQQISPVEKEGSPTQTIQKPLSSKVDFEICGSKPEESIEYTKLEEVSHHNPLIKRRRVRSFISPIPSKRRFLDDKTQPPSTILKEGCDKALVLHMSSPRLSDGDFMSEESSKSISEQRSPSGVSLLSPQKTTILPLHKGRGLKLEAIVQKMISPNVRRTATPSSLQTAAEHVTLDDILSPTTKGLESNIDYMQEAEQSDVILDIANNVDMTIKGFSPKSCDPRSIHDEKLIKKEAEAMECKDFSQSELLINQSFSHSMEGKEISPALESKHSLSQIQQCGVLDKEKPATPKQEVIPSKGYFPSGKKRGRPIGSVSKQKKQLQQQIKQQHWQQQEQSLTTTSLTSSLLSTPKQTQSVSEQGLKPEVQPKKEHIKQAGTTRTRRRNLAVPDVNLIEPETKLTYATKTTVKMETKAKSFFPYVHVDNKEYLGASCVIINAEEEEQFCKKQTSIQKGQRTTSLKASESKAFPNSSFMVQGPVVTESVSMGHLVCCFCGKWANYKNLGDLFGPFYTEDYASTLSKNSPPKKSSETSRKEVLHKDSLDGSKTHSNEEEEEEPQQARQQRSLSVHPRYKHRNRSGDCPSSRHAVPSCSTTSEPCELSLDSSGQSIVDVIPCQGFHISQVPIDSNEFWMHEGCVLWANGVYFVCGRLYGLQEAFDIARDMICANCQEPGATFGCYSKGCVCCYHFPCALNSECILSEENFSVCCPKHKAPI